MKRYHIHIQGRVQGVGFRPFVYRVARSRGLRGWISNTKDGVHIEILAENERQISELCDHIGSSCPPQARIEKLDYQIVPFQESGSFEIRMSSNSGIATMPLTPDFAICEECKSDLFDPHNRRYQYPFITCTNCGPRFSIIHQVPYDRELTTMESFQMCRACSDEYNNPVDRRFFSQTNSCPDCPVELELYHANGQRIEGDQESIIRYVSRAILKEKIVAVKGIGGYLLMADATSSPAIITLRRRKKRPTKPFALMYPSVKDTANDVIIHELILENWKSPECPIVLCTAKQSSWFGIKKELIAPGLNRLGIMMPYAPLFLLLLREIKGPVIATSGNITDSPILYRDQEALAALSDMADYILVNNREILIPQDDSVIQFSPFQRQKIILRRSRGMAPSMAPPPILNDFKESLLAMGAMLKSTFGVFHQDRLYISQYLGNTGTLSSQENYEKVIDHLARVLDFRPSKILVDLHPDYPSTLLGENLSERFNIPLHAIQHHEAHACAVLGENNLLDRENVLCVIWDGTGLGHDHQIWGGEFFRYRNQTLDRIAHWDYFDHLAGDRMSREPRLSLLSLISKEPALHELVRSKFSPDEFSNFLRVISRNSLKTSSAGRLFDAVASLLGFADFNSYEGEAAMYLEAKAMEAYETNPDFDLYYEVVDEDPLNIQELIRLIGRDLQQKKLDREFIALKFHVSMVKCIERIALRYGLGHLAFSGGVFQNALLVDLIIRDLGCKFELFFHKELSPNDESISYGQLMKYYVSEYLVKNMKLVNIRSSE